MNPENESRTVPEEARATADSLEDILRRAEEEGDSSVVPQIQEMLKSPEVMDALGNLAGRVEFTMVAAVSGANAITQEALTKKLAEMRTELAGPDPTPLERSSSSGSSFPGWPFTTPSCGRP